MSHPKQAPIYLDYQATTPVDARVMEKMLPFFTQHFGNAHSAGHAYGWAAEEACDIAREQVASLIQAHAKEIIFTSGATEANNLAIKGLAQFHLSQDGKKRHIITQATEHKAVLAVCESLQALGFHITTLSVQKSGLIDLAQLEAALSENTLLVSIMAVNNEIGVIQPLAEIGALCRKAGAFFHTDAAQAFGKITLDVEAMNIDLLSISGHKAYAPKGIGALYVRHKPRVRLQPLFSGGGQERTLRAGTLPVPLVVALGEAASVAAGEMHTEQARLLTLRDLFLEKLKPVSVHFRINGDMENRIAGNLNLSFPEISEDKLILALRELAVSTGSACNSGGNAPSYVLQSIGVSEKTAKSSLRFGFGRFTTEDEVLQAASLLVTKLQELLDRSY